MRERSSGGSRLLVAALTLLLSEVGRVDAAIIIWGPATNVSGDTDVSIDGTLVAAFNIGAPDVPTTTVNGVTLTALGLSGSTVTSGNFTFQAPQPFLFNDDVGSTNPPFSTLSAPYQTLLSSFAGRGPFTLTISGLTPGHSYEFEWWTSESANALSGIFTTATAGSSVELNANTAGQVGGTGQFAIGTFTADGPNEVITFTGSPLTFLDGLELREVPVPVPVPEPSSLALFALGGAVAGWRRRRERGRGASAVTRSPTCTTWRNWPSN
jgi:hypothetical protein